MFAHLLHPRFVGAEVAEHQLPVERTHHQPARDVTGVVQWPAERHQRGLGDHRLVEVEEGCLHAFHDMRAWAIATVTARH
jgi:hypothetical protein